MLFFVLLISALILLFIPHGVTGKLQFAFAHFFRRPLHAGRQILLSAHAHQSSSGFISYREYNQLRNYLVNVMGELDQERQHVEKLSGLRTRRSLEHARLVLCDVITASINGLHSELLINRGTCDGLEKGQYVLGDNSIIGVISDVSSHTARVKLTTDPMCKIPVKMPGSDSVWLMQGEGGDLARVQFVSVKYKIKTGDVVYVDKKPGFLDNPTITGTVARCERCDDNPLLWDITVKPASELSRLSELAVIIMNPRE
jgi:rod shape-determining protein MreC